MNYDEINEAIQNVKNFTSIQIKILRCCIYAIKYMDQSKFKELEVNIEEDIAPTRFKIQIEDQSIVHSIIVNNIDCTDYKNI